MRYGEIEFRKREKSERVGEAVIRCRGRGGGEEKVGSCLATEEEGEGGGGNEMRSNHAREQSRLCSFLFGGRKRVGPPAA